MRIRLLTRRYHFLPLIWLLVGAILAGLWLVVWQRHFFMRMAGVFRTENEPEEIVVSEAAKNLPTSGSILAFITTHPNNHFDKVLALNATWVPRIDHAVFFTSEPMLHNSIPYRTAYSGFDDSYDQLWYKTRFGFFYTYTHISAMFDWYMKVDDDTYVVAENLRRFLKDFDPREPIYAGFRLKEDLEHGYNSGSGYILSRRAVQIFVEDLYNDQVNCRYHLYEDVAMGKCLESKKIFPVPSRDSERRGRFEIFDAYKTYLNDPTKIDFREYYFDNHFDGFREFSPRLITLHHMRPRDVITADLFLYRVKITDDQS